MIGEGDVVHDGKHMSAAAAMKKTEIRPLELHAKEAISLINGTQGMLAIGVLAILEAEVIADAADVIGALTLDALKGTDVAFDERIQNARPHAGQVLVARNLRRVLEGSIIRESHLECQKVQDAYSMRCMPQVHGAVRNALLHARETVEIESGSATDNPLVFAEEGDVLSGGNFHGAPLAMVFDYAAIAMTDLMSIAERRIDRLVNPDLNEGLPPFLSPEPGLSSGYMIAHIAAAALLNEAKVLAHPSVVDNVPTSGGKEDHVSMGMTSALKLRQIVDNAEQVLAIELMAACDGLEYRAPLRSSPIIERARRRIRAHVAPLKADRPLTKDIESIARAIRKGDFDEFD
jgi:histidine ammonia-lyase